MRYKLIIFDIDGTITQHVSSWRYIHERLGIWTKRAFQYQNAFFAGRISYKKFCHFDAAHWKGMPEAKIRRLFNKTIYSRGAKIYLSRLKKMGFRLAAVSTGLQYMPERIEKELGFEYTISNRLLSRNGMLTGGVKINLEHGAKDKILKDMFARFRVKPGQVICIGDTEGDIPLVRHCGYSIAFNSSSKKLSKVVDYNCKTKNFREVYRTILRAQNL